MSIELFQGLCCGTNKKRMPLLLHSLKAECSETDPKNLQNKSTIRQWLQFITNKLWMTNKHINIYEAKTVIAFQIYLLLAIIKFV